MVMGPTSVKLLVFALMGLIALCVCNSRNWSCGATGIFRLWIAAI